MRRKRRVKRQAYGTGESRTRTPTRALRQAHTSKVTDEEFCSIALLQGVQCSMFNNVPRLGSHKCTHSRTFELSQAPGGWYREGNKRRTTAAHGPHMLITVVALRSMSRSRAYLAKGIPVCLR
jgi:hypothetical protein